jgi:hypothetical protein
MREPSLQAVTGNHFHRALHSTPLPSVKPSLTSGVQYFSREKLSRSKRTQGPFGSSGFKTGPAKLHPNLENRAFSKLEHAILAGAGFETGATERALTVFFAVASSTSLRVSGPGPG